MAADCEIPYIAHWLRIMNADNEAIFAALQAVDYLNDLLASTKATAA